MMGTKRWGEDLSQVLDFQKPESRTQRFHVRTLGCKANYYDSQVMAESLRAQGWAEATGDEESDLVIVNSCSVTTEADRQSVRMARGEKRRHPGAKIVFTGCSAEIDPAKYEKLEAITRVVSNREKATFAQEILGEDGAVSVGESIRYQGFRSRHPMDRKWESPDFGSSLPHQERTRATLKIQEGCDAFCTFCIIPYGRGPARSLSPEMVIEHVRTAIKRGALEIVLTGTNLGDYGTDLGEKRPEGFEKLVKKILTETGIGRLRLSSLDPIEVTPGLCELMQNEQRLCPHFHISAQSASDWVLKRMKRRTREQDLIECLERINKISREDGPVYVGMDLIAGFPGESEQEFVRSTRLLESLPWVRLHVFPYSERTGTPATRLPESVRIETRKQRASLLSDLSLVRLEQFVRSVMEAHPEGLKDVLLESPVKGPDGSRDWVLGHTPNYLRVLIRGEHPANQVVRVKPTGVLVDRDRIEVALLAQMAE